MQPNSPGATNSDRGLSIPNRGQNTSVTPPDRTAAAAVVRQQIGRIYDTDPPNQPQNSPASTQLPADSAYARQHNTEKSAQNWQAYHTAWQYYYQQYYHRYYLAQLHAQERSRQAHQANEAARHNLDQLSTPATVVSEQPADEESSRPSRAIKNELVQKIAERGRRLRQSHHFLPIISALVVGVLFLFIQYNQLISAQVFAYVSPGSADPQNIILDPTADTKVSADPRLIIPKINVDVPVVYNVSSLDERVVEDALRGGVVHYPIPGANSVPGQVGNTVILGHSSNDVFDPGQYKFAFLFLNRLQKGDTFYVNYQSTRYTYSITDIKIIEPNEVSKLVVTTDKPLVTLVTCTPAGTALHRLVVTAEQISPDPTKAGSAPTTDAGKPTGIPGNAPTLFESIFGQG